MTPTRFSRLSIARRPKFLGVLACTALSALALSSHAGASPWQWSVEPGVWRPEVELDATIADRIGTSNQVRIDAELAESDVAPRLAFEGRAGRHGFAVEASRWQIEAVERSAFPAFLGSVVARASLELSVVDLAGVFNPRGDGNGLSLLYGARLMHSTQRVSAEFTSPFFSDLAYDFSQDLADAMVGARFVQPFAARWSVRVRAGASRGTSKLGFDAALGVGVALGRAQRVTLRAEYRYLKLDFDGRSGSARIDSTIVNRGPLLGLAVAF